MKAAVIDRGGELERLLAEVARLVVACAQPLASERAYYLVQPERADERPVIKTFLGWLQQAAAQAL